MRKASSCRIGTSEYARETVRTNTLGAVQDKMVYDFDVVCLQETRTCHNRPLVLQDFKSFRGCGMAMAARADLIKTVSSINFDKWCTRNAGYSNKQIICSTGKRRTSLTLVNAYLYPSTCITGASWDCFQGMKTNSEIHSGYAVISMHAQVCGFDKAPTNICLHYRKHLTTSSSLLC